MDLKSGLKSSEFIGLIGLFALVVASATGWLRPETVQKAAENINQTAGAMPALIQAVKDVINNNSEILIYAGVAYAYIKRRSGLKAKAMK